MQYNGLGRNGAGRATAGKRVEPRAEPEVVRSIADAAAGIVTFMLVQPPVRSAVVLGVVTLVALRVLRGSTVPRPLPSLWDDAPSITAGVAVATIATGLSAPSETPAGEVAWLGVFALFLALAFRVLAYEVLRGRRRRGKDLLLTVVTGAGPTSAAVAEALLMHPEFGLRPVGFVDDVSDPALDLPMLGGLEELPEILDQNKVQAMVVGFGTQPDWKLVEIIRSTHERRIELYVLPRLFEMGIGLLEGVEIRSIPLLRVRRSGPGQPTWRLKRAVDVVGAVLGLIVSAPVMFTAAVAVRLSSPGPVLFRQKRVGRNGEVFELLKFRTMLVNDDADTTWSVSNDDRRTRVGRVLRVSHIDELPQLINIVRGEMSLVGPRPERPYFVDQFASEYRRYEDRHRVPGGMTGWAQIHGLVGDTSIEERVRFDNSYIDRWTLGQDLRILARTPTSILRTKLAARKKRSMPAADAGTPDLRVVRGSQRDGEFLKKESGQQ